MIHLLSVHMDSTKPRSCRTDPERMTSEVKLVIVSQRSKHIRDILVGSPKGESRGVGSCKGLGL